MSWDNLSFFKPISIQFFPLRCDYPWWYLFIRFHFPRILRKLAHVKVISTVLQKEKCCFLKLRIRLILRIISCNQRNLWLNLNSKLVLNLQITVLRTDKIIQDKLSQTYYSIDFLWIAFVRRIYQSLKSIIYLSAWCLQQCFHTQIHLYLYNKA